MGTLLGTLYIVGTPIGNLEDLTLRALRMLKEVDLILCEDTRVTKALLERYHIQKQTISYHQHSKLQKTEQILQLLKEGKNLALVCDAGTPGISDPGKELVARVFEAKLQTVRIVPIPGPSALTAIASIAGFSMDKFVFLGFPPVKKGRKKFFEQIVRAEYPVIFYESPYRVIKSLSQLQLAISNEQSTMKVVVGRELTKKFETIYRGTVQQILKDLGNEKPRGEFVIVVDAGN